MFKRQCNQDTSIQNVCKKYKTDDSEGNGIIIEDNMPAATFALGDSVFVVIKTFQRNVVVHLRKYKKYGKKYYPTSTGVTLRPWWTEYIMGINAVPKSKPELNGGAYLPEDQIKITSEDFENFVFERFTVGYDRKTLTRNIEITFAQWSEMIYQYDAIASCVLEHYFRSMDFTNAYFRFCEGPIEKSLPASLDVSIGEEFVLKLLRESLCEMFLDGGLKEPERIAEELCANKAKTFNSIAFHIDVMDFANKFYNNLPNSKNSLLLSPLSYVTGDFLRSVRMDDILRDVKSFLCPPDTYEYFEDIDTQMYV